MANNESKIWIHERLDNPVEDLYFASLFARPNLRPAVSAAAALFIELEAIAGHTGDMNVARTKLAWWREELARLEAGRATHPVTRTLASTQAKVPLSALMDLITGMELVIMEGGVDDLDAARVRARRSCAPLAVVLDAIDASVQTSPAETMALGEAVGLARLLSQNLTDPLRPNVIHAARAALGETAEIAQRSAVPLRILAALAWRRTVKAPPLKRRETAMRPFVAWRAARGSLPGGLTSPG